MQLTVCFVSDGQRTKQFVKRNLNFSAKSSGIWRILCVRGWGWGGVATVLSFGINHDWAKLTWYRDINWCLSIIYRISLLESCVFISEVSLYSLTLTLILGRSLNIYPLNTRKNLLISPKCFKTKLNLLYILPSHDNQSSMLCEIYPGVYVK